VSEVVTFGETMALLTPPRVGLLRHADSLRLGIAGAETNVAIGLARLGRSATWIGRVGDDEFGRLIAETLRGQGVDTRAITDPVAATGLMLKEHRMSRATRVVYYRTGSAGSRLTSADLPADVITAARVLHVTGITPALSASARDATLAAVETARSAGVTTSFDLNYRSALWTGDEAAVVYRDLIGRSDIVFATEEEARLVVDGEGPEALAAALRALGPSTVIVKRGSAGAVAIADDELVTVPPVLVPVVDSVGAGDAFTAGFLAGVVAESGPEESLRLASWTGAFAVTVNGDWEGSPSTEELGLLFGVEGDVIR
jgi:2-dehydro-3-deoxygluconokinase